MSAMTPDGARLSNPHHRVQASLERDGKGKFQRPRCLAAFSLPMQAKAKSTLAISCGLSAA